MNDRFENIVQSDPTLRFFLRETTLEYDLLDHQVDVKCAAIMIAINKFIYG